MTSGIAKCQALFGIFVLSGFTSLIYESIWSQYLKLFLGHAAYAQTLVLAIFMGGMALGSWIIARNSTRIRRLLLAYMLVEAVIGVLGLVFHPLFTSLTGWTFDSVIPALSSGAAINAFKWTLATALILPQSTLLGMTFPLISNGIIRRWPEQPGEALSMLYFTNSLGAAIGVLVAGFVRNVMLAMGALALLTLPAYNASFDFMAWTLRTLARTQSGYTAFNLASHALALLIMLPVTFCAGMTLPLLTHALLRRGGERAIGTVYAANTLGAIFGVLLAVHLVMPTLGVKASSPGERPCTWRWVSRVW
jgi:predicted membrane-bound spermidine synthase